MEQKFFRNGQWLTADQLRKLNQSKEIEIIEIKKEIKKSSIKKKK